MNLKRAIGWVALGTAMLASAMMLALVIGHWHTRSLDEQGRALVVEEQYLPAIRMLSAVVAEAPGDARAHYYLGLAYAGIGMCGAAWIHLDEAARLAPAFRRLRGGPGPACREAAVMRGAGPVRSRGQD
jgi:Flp pilus assembly protein TadD